MIHVGDRVQFEGVVVRKEEAKPGKKQLYYVREAPGIAFQDKDIKKVIDCEQAEPTLRMPTRDEAVRALYHMINSGVLHLELEETIGDIARCIEGERDGLFLWGADPDYADLYVCKRDDLITPEWEEHCDELYEKYRIKEAEDHVSQ